MSPLCVIGLPRRLLETDPEVVEVLSVVAHDSALVARPTAEVPIFSRRYRPSVAVAPELERAIDALCFTAQDEG